jgi:hypothetical protein
MKLLISTALAVFALTACNSGDDASKAASPGSQSDLTLRATSDIKTAVPIKAATFVPNSVATWLGHIILLDKQGKLHRATTDSAETAPVALGKYADVIGLKRDKKSGVFLALTPQGDIKAFVQTDDAGNFGPMAVSQGGQTFERFCATAEPRENTIWAKTTSKASQKLTIEIFEDSSLTLIAAESTGEETDPCSANNALSLTQDYTLKPSEAANGLTLTSDSETLSLDITNGLSIGGISDAGLVTVTTANMGSVFNQGVVLVAEENENRIVLISRDYILKELKAP